MLMLINRIRNFVVRFFRWLKPKVKTFCYWCDELKKPFILIASISAAIGAVITVYKLICSL